MDVQKIEVGAEDFISRLPGLFPYLEWKSDGTIETHLATDSDNGCYGKFIDNMKIPKNVRLTNYVQVPKEDFFDTYEWNDTNTIGVLEDTNAYLSSSESLYLRKALWYGYEKTDEEFQDAVLLESFPYSVTDDSPQHIKMVKRTPNGVIVTCEETVFYDYYDKKGNYYYYKRTDIIKPCETYSYRTIINNYYKYKDIVGGNNSFINFVDTAIGCITVDKRLLNIDDDTIYKEVPSFIYLSQVKKLKSEYDALRNAYTHYITYYLANGKTSKPLEEEANKYIRMGGDNFRNWLGQQIQKSYSVSEYYKCCADNKDYPPSFNSNIMLTKTSQVVGIEEVYENTFVPGNRYYDGDLLTYDGRTYICKIDRIVQGGDNYEYIKKTVDVEGVYVNVLFVLDEAQTVYQPISNTNISYTTRDIWDESVFTTDFVSVEGAYYRWDQENDKYEPIDVREYSTGAWDEESERYVFDWQHFVLLSELEGYDEWYDSDNLYGENFKFFVDVDAKPVVRVYDYIRFNNSIFEWDEETEEYVPVTGDEHLIFLTTNSKLKDLRITREFINSFGESETPNLDEDWLFYYKVGKVNGLMVQTDEIGNIISDNEDFISGNPNYGLHAYGNIITSITFNNDENTLTFTYVMGAHLVAIADRKYIDEDGNQILCYRDFSYDAYSDDGITFTETYKCKDDSISNLGEDFQPYVEGEPEAVIRHSYEKFPFETIPVISVDGTLTIEGNGVAGIDIYGNMTHSKTIRKEWMHGLYYRPKISSKLSIERGNGASFDRHVRLGEIHTMEDLETYQNGAYYKLSEN